MRYCTTWAWWSTMELTSLSSTREGQPRGDGRLMSRVDQQDHFFLHGLSSPVFSWRSTSHSLGWMSCLASLSTYNRITRHSQSMGRGLLNYHIMQHFLFPPRLEGEEVCQGVLLWYLRFLWPDRQRYGMIPLVY